MTLKCFYMDCFFLCEISTSVFKMCWNSHYIFIFLFSKIRINQGFVPQMCRIVNITIAHERLNYIFFCCCFFSQDFIYLSMLRPSRIHGCGKSCTLWETSGHPSIITLACMVAWSILVFSTGSSEEKSRGHLNTVVSIMVQNVHSIFFFPLSEIWG